jgi:uncharacterized membrane protein YidH (DUF202 family)
VSRTPSAGSSSPGPSGGDGTDAGLAAARTLLAWSRTGLSFVGLGGAISKVAPLAGASIVALGGFIWLLGYVERRGGRRGTRALSSLDRAARLRLVAFGTALVALLSLLLAVVNGIWG